MEYSAQDISYSTANLRSFSGDGAASEEESGWTSYIDYFMETQRRQQETEATSCAADHHPSTNDDAVVVCRRPTSSGEYSADCGAVAGGSTTPSTRLPALVEPSSEAPSRKLSLRMQEARRKKALYDESLEDTATSPISSPKLVESRESDANHQKKDAYHELSHSKKYSADEPGCNKNNHSNTGGGTTSGDDVAKQDDIDAYDSNALRKKGLCLVPVSAFHV